MDGIDNIFFKNVLFARAINISFGKIYNIIDEEIKKIINCLYNEIKNENDIKSVFNKFLSTRGIIVYHKLNQIPLRQLILEALLHHKN